MLQPGNPMENIRWQRVFTWAVTTLLIYSSPLLSQWLVVVIGKAQPPTGPKAPTCSQSFPSVSCSSSPIFTVGFPHLSLQDTDTMFCRAVH